MATVKVVPSAAFVSVLEELASLPGVVVPSAVKEAALLSAKDVRWCREQIKERRLPHRIHALLSQSRVIIPGYEPPPRSPELEARIERLRAEQSNREYRKMTRNLVVDQFEMASLRGIGTDIRSLRVEMREMNRQLVTAAQYLVSIVGTFFAVFVALGFAFHDVGPRVLFAIVCAMAVALAEIYFIIRQDIVEEENVRKKMV